MILRPDYPDRSLRLIAIPLWGIAYRNIGEVTPISSLLKDPVYYLDVAVGTLATFGVWELNRYIIRLMDRRYSWVDHTAVRLLIQGLLCFGLSGLIVLLLSFVYNTYVVDRHPLFNIGVVFMTDIPMSWMFLLVMHLLYAGMWLRAYHQQVVSGLYAQIRELDHRESRSEPARPALRSLLVNQGRAQTPLDIAEIAHVSIVGELCLVRTFQGLSYSLDQSLEQIAGLLPADDFFRLNRQILVHRRAVKKVAPDSSGRLLLSLDPAFSEEVAVSRKRAPAFRSWMTGAPAPKAQET